MSGGSKSKNKGSGAERELCKKLGDIFGGSFIRSNNSGAYIGGKNVFRKQNLSVNQTTSMKGDIQPPDELSHLVFESKFYASFLFHQLMMDECSILDGWIKQTLDVIDDNDTWFVVFKINRLGWYVCTPFKSDYKLNSHAMYHSKHGTMVVSQLENFFVDNKEILIIPTKNIAQDKT